MPLDPITRSEQFYSRIAGESGAEIEPKTREEHFLARIAGDADAKVLEPKTRTEHFLQQIIDSGGGGGDITVESLPVTENGTYTAPSGKAYSPVTVNVPSGGGSYETWTGGAY